MEVTHKRLNRVDVLTVTGRLDAESADKLEEELNKVFKERRYHILLDFAGLDYISSPGLRILAQARKQARDGQIVGVGGGDIRIVNLQPRMRELFDLVGFTPMFKIYSDMVEAVGSF